MDINGDLILDLQMFRVWYVLGRDLKKLNYMILYISLKIHIGTLDSNLRIRNSFPIWLLIWLFWVFECIGWNNGNLVFELGRFLESQLFLINIEFGIILYF